jgi:hypothetical protein
MNENTNTLIAINENIEQLISTNKDIISELRFSRVFISIMFMILVVTFAHH